MNVNGGHVVDSIDDLNACWYDGVGVYQCFELSTEGAFFTRAYGDFPTRGDVKVRRVDADSECGGGRLSVSTPDRSVRRTVDGV